MKTIDDMIGLFREKTYYENEEENCGLMPKVCIQIVKHFGQKVYFLVVISWQTTAGNIGCILLPKWELGLTTCDPK